MIAYLDYPMQYLGPLYIMLYGFWLIRENKAILFWLYLWQLKEYHWGRFLDHFSTAKGKRIFLNPIFFVKTILLIAASSVYVFIRFSGKGAYFFSSGFSFFLSPDYSYAIYFFSFSVLFIFVAETAWTLVVFFKKSIIAPVLTKKTVIFIGITHLMAFTLVLFLYNSILGEMGFFDIACAAFVLLFFDMATPFFVGLVVILFQPLTILEKNKILAKAKKIRQSRPDLTVIGIAGSYGKSITKELLACILSQKHKVLKTTANQNTEVGVSLALIEELKPYHEFFICEIGAVHKGKIRLVANAVRPQIGILSGINQQHMAVFGSQQKIIEAKYEILEALPKEGTAILNWNSELVQQSYESQKNRIKAKTIVLAGKDLAASEVKVNAYQLSFKVSYKGEMVVLDTNARGLYNVEPILLVMAGALASGMGLREIAGILNKTDFSPFNIVIGKNPDGISVFSSTYSANPDGVLAHLEYLKLWPGKKAIVMPCLIELGRSSKDVHYHVGQKIAGVCDLAVITTKDYYSDIRKGAEFGGLKKESILFLEKPAMIKKKIKDSLGLNGTLLLEGRLPQALIEALKN